MDKIVIIGFGFHFTKIYFDYILKMHQSQKIKISLIVDLQNKRKIIKK